MRYETLLANVRNDLDEAMAAGLGASEVLKSIDERAEAALRPYMPRSRPETVAAFLMDNPEILRWKLDEHGNRFARLRSWAIGHGVGGMWSVPPDQRPPLPTYNSANLFISDLVLDQLEKDLREHVAKVMESELPLQQAILTLYEAARAIESYYSPLSEELEIDLVENVLRGQIDRESMHMVFLMLLIVGEWYRRADQEVPEPVKARFLSTRPVFDRIEALKAALGIDGFVATISRELAPEQLN